IERGLAAHLHRGAAHLEQQDGHVLGLGLVLAAVAVDPALLFADGDTEGSRMLGHIGSSPGGGSGGLNPSVKPRSRSHSTDSSRSAVSMDGTCMRALCMAMSRAASLRALG